MRTRRTRSGGKGFTKSRRRRFSHRLNLLTSSNTLSLHRFLLRPELPFQCALFCSNFRAKFSFASSKSFRPRPLSEPSILLCFHYNTCAPLQIGFRHRILSTHSLFGSLLFMTQGRQLPKVTKVDIRLRPFCRTRDRSFGGSETKPICRFLRPGVIRICFFNHRFSPFTSVRLQPLDNSTMLPFGLGFHQSHAARRQESRFLRPLSASG